MTEPTTRELLEGAARAAGKHANEWVEPGQINEKGGFVQWIGFGRVSTWHPLTDMADCFEMETALKIDIEWYDDFVAADQDFDTGHRIRAHFADHNHDRKAARMYASTRCAFEISEGM